jgi:hypothetical protein
MSNDSTDSSSTASERRDVDTNTDEEKAIGLEEIKTAKEKQQEQGEHLSQSGTSTKLTPTKSLRSLHSHCSYTANDGYTSYPAQDDEERPSKSSGDTGGEPFLVKWDGDSDPMNPRSMSKFRRWIIVLIVSSSSLCV